LGPDQDFLGQFDLIAGTSVGGVAGLMMAAANPGQDL